MGIKGRRQKKRATGIGRKKNAKKPIRPWKKSMRIKRGIKERKRIEELKKEAERIEKELLMKAEDSVNKENYLLAAHCFARIGKYGNAKASLRNHIYMSKFKTDKFQKREEFLRVLRNETYYMTDVEVVEVSSGLAYFEGQAKETEKREHYEPPHNTLMRYAASRIKAGKKSSLVLYFSYVEGRKNAKAGNYAIASENFFAAGDYKKAVWASRKGNTPLIELDVYFATGDATKALKLMERKLAEKDTKFIADVFHTRMHLFDLIIEKNPALATHIASNGFILVKCPKSLKHKIKKIAAKFAETGAHIEATHWYAIINEFYLAGLESMKAYKKHKSLPQLAISARIFKKAKHFRRAGLAFFEYFKKSGNYLKNSIECFRQAGMVGWQAKAVNEREHMQRRNPSTDITLADKKDLKHFLEADKLFEKAEQIKENAMEQLEKVAKSKGYKAMVDHVEIPFIVEELEKSGLTCAEGLIICLNKLAAHGKIKEENLMNLLETYKGYNLIAEEDFPEIIKGFYEHRLKTVKEADKKAQKVLDKSSQIMKKVDALLQEYKKRIDKNLNKTK